MTKVISDEVAALRPTDDEQRHGEDPVFEVPGPGSWELETTHFPRPFRQVWRGGNHGGLPSRVR
jgi:hypothetical protein